MKQEHWIKQRDRSDKFFLRGPREHVDSVDPLVRYITDWRIRTGFIRLVEEAGKRLSLIAA